MNLSTTGRVGSKYVPGRDVTDIAKDIRRDIKQARADGTLTLPKDAKVSVLINRYSMGQSIDIHVTGLTNEQVWVPTENNMRLRWSDYRNAAHTVITAIMDSYNRDNSDSLSDYYDVAFAGDVTFHSPVS